MKKNANKILLISLFLLLFVLAFQTTAYALEDLPLTIPEGVEFDALPGEDPVGVTTPLQVLVMFTLIALFPFLLMMITSFTRIIISLHFMRAALGTQQMPPGQVLIGLALVLTFYLMAPVFTEFYDNAWVPYGAQQIDTADLIEVGMEPFRDFMLRQVEVQDLALFMRIADFEYTPGIEIPNRILIPSFVLGELTKAFRIGFLLFLPFIVIDMVVASCLMAMGMMMLPPAMISMPFKILLFIMVDGWPLVVEGIILTFR